jgi:soluble lytic murein transglycosylase-like protein
VRLIVGDAKDGFVEISRNSLAVLGLLVVALALVLAIRPALQEVATQQLMAWLAARQLPTGWAPSAGYAALQRTTAGNPLDLPAEQTSVTYWLSRKYSVAPEPLSVLVAQAFELGERAHIAPTLILAIMAIESNFNPYAQSTLGGLGLMQIQPSQQSDKLDSLGGTMASFDPVSNMRIGVRLLQELSVEKGSIQAGLAAYADITKSRESNYLERVLQEEQRLSRVAHSVRQARESSIESTSKTQPNRWPSAPKSAAIAL